MLCMTCNEPPKPSCDPDCYVKRVKLYILYGAFLLACVALALSHFIITMLKRRRVKKSARDYQLRRESFAALGSTPLPSKIEFASVKDSFKITTDGATGMVIEIPEDYPFPILRNGLENGGRYSIVSFTDHRYRPLAMEQRNYSVEGMKNTLQKIPPFEKEDSCNVLSHRNMNTNIVHVDVHTNNQRNSTISGNSFHRGFGRSLAVATVSQSYNNMHGTPVPVGGSDPVGGVGVGVGVGVGRVSRPQSSLSVYDISDIVQSSPETGGRKAEPKKSPKTC